MPARPAARGRPLVTLVMLAVASAGCARGTPPPAAATGDPPSPAAATLHGPALAERAARLARTAGCTPVQRVRDEGREHVAPGGPPPRYGTVPAASGTHAPRALPPGVPVYQRPVSEPRAVHNLEHGYVLLYHAPGSVPAGVRRALAGVAAATRKVIAAPHRGLPPEWPLAFVAWARLQRCPASIAAEDAAVVARAFVERFRGAESAPDPMDP